MIRIKRWDLPRVLRGSPTIGTHYNKPSVVKTLWAMQNEKCCYCEQKIPVWGHAKAVEHYRPQSVFKCKINHWPNLLLACSQCNGKKSNKFPVELTNDSGQPKVVYLKRNRQGKPLIIDPSDKNIDPEEHIDFVVDNGVAEFGMAKAKKRAGTGTESQLGRITIRAVGLSDLHYVRERKGFARLLDQIYCQILEAEDQREGDVLDVAKRDFAMRLSAKGKFAGFARAYARTKESKLKDLGIRIPKGAETS